MTLIVGILNEDGVVIASDGEATLGNLGLQTTSQQTKKLSIVQEKIIIGVSGPVGLGQLLTGEIDKIYSEGALSGKKPVEAMTIIAQRFRTHIFPELEAAQKAQVINGIGGTAGMSAITFTLLAIPVSDEPCLLQFNQQGAPEQSTHDIPFASIGSGEQIADPFLAFIKRVLWKGKFPNKGDAIFAAVWTIKHVIKTNTGGIGDPIQVIVLEKKDKEWNAHELMEEELNEVKESVERMEEYISDFNKLVPESEKDKKLPAIPKPEKSKE